MAGLAGIEPTSLGSKPSILSVERKTDCVAGDIGFEPMRGGIKIRCLNRAWLISNKMADRVGIEPTSHGLTVRPHTDVRFGQ
jgi:hypothetical protein